VAYSSFGPELFFSALLYKTLSLYSSINVIERRLMNLKKFSHDTCGIGEGKDKSWSILEGH